MKSQGIFKTILSGNPVILRQTLSKALLISQNTTPTSLPLSTASREEWYVCKSWKVV